MPPKAPMPQKTQSEVGDQTANEKVEEEGKKQQVELQLQPLKIKPEEFLDFATDYYQKLVPAMKESFATPELLFKQMEAGYERH